MGSSRMLFVLETGAQRPFNHGFMCFGWPAERAFLSNASAGKSVHEAALFCQSRRDSGHVDGITSAEHAGSVYLSVDIGILGPIFAPATGTSEFGGGTTHTAALIG
ncbi:hypothetical protein E4U61_000707 [Claviceps capensis]|nr:hypothetical protein E4U61_000707 [Claviceps capensis]